MATANLTVSGCWYGTGYYETWNEADHIRVGLADGAYYRSKLEISTAGITMVTCEKLVVALTLSEKSSPVGLIGVLTTNSTIAANDCQEGASATAPSAEILEGCIAQSYAYADAAGSNLLDSSDGVNLASGTTVYLIFKTTALKAEKKYYLYLLRNHRDGYEGSCYVRALKAGIVPTLTYYNYSACTAPTAVTATPAVFEGTVSLAWSGAAAGTNNAITGYQIRYRTSTDGSTWGSWTTHGTLTANPASIDMSGLGRGTYLQFSVRTLGAAGSDYYSEWKSSGSIRRNQLPVTPASISASASVVRSGDEVTLTWPAGSDPDGNLSKYIIEKLQGGTWTRVYYDAVRSYTDTVTGNPGEEIRYAVLSVDGLGAASSDWTVRAAVTINSAPVAPSAAKLDKQEYSPGDSVTASWSGAEDADGNIAGYSIGYTLEESGEPVVLGSISTAQASGTYTFVPEQAAYQETVFIWVQTFDSLGAVSVWKLAGLLYRNDTPYGHIYRDGAAEGHTPQIFENNVPAAHMPYVRQNGIWVRCGGK